MDVQLVIVLFIVAISAWVVIKKISSATKNGDCGCSGCNGGGANVSGKKCGEDKDSVIDKN